MYVLFSYHVCISLATDHKKGLLEYMLSSAVLTDGLQQGCSVLSFTL